MIYQGMYQRMQYETVTQRSEKVKQKLRRHTSNYVQQDEGS